MQHRFILSYLRRPSRRYHNDAAAAAAETSSVVTSINWVRDRALDHAVEKERDLKPMLNLKNLLNSEPSKSLPISIISDKRASLGIPIRPIDFIRKYPSVFHEFLPAGLGIQIHPHVKLTPETLTLDSEEQLLFQSEIHKQDVANRLLKLLMISRINKLPLCVIDRLKWDLGLPHDYTQSVVPQFPDYFQVTSNGKELELVCWSDEQAVSVMEKKSMTSFPLQYSRGFEIDKKFKKWVDGWQKLPYVSPYKNAIDLQAKSDESDKWIVGLLHEVLHLLVPKRTEKENLLFLGEYLGVRSRFKRALLQHPGIFYVSSKLNTHTVVLREAYKRDLLVSKPQHPLMILRSKYIHFMNMVTVNKSKNTHQVVGPKKEKNITQDSNEGEEDNEWSDTEEDETESSLSNSESEGVVNGDSDDDYMEGDELDVNGRIPTKNTKFEGEVSLKQTENISVQKGRKHISNDDSDQENGNGKSGGSTMKFNRNDSPRRNTPNARSSENDGRRRGRGKTRKNLFDEKMNSETNKMSERRGRGIGRKNMFDEKMNSETNQMSERRGRGIGRKNMLDEKMNSETNQMTERRGRGISRKNMFDEKMNSETNQMSERRSRGISRKNMFNEKMNSETNKMSERRGTRETNPPRFLRTEVPGAQKARGKSSDRSSISRTRGSRF